MKMRPVFPETSNATSRSETYGAATGFGFDGVIVRESKLCEPESSVSTRDDTCVCVFPGNTLDGPGVSHAPHHRSADAFKSVHLLHVHYEPVAVANRASSFESSDAFAGDSVKSIADFGFCVLPAVLLFPAPPAKNARMSGTWIPPGMSDASVPSPTAPAPGAAMNAPPAGLLAKCDIKFGSTPASTTSAPSSVAAPSRVFPSRSSFREIAGHITSSRVPAAHRNRTFTGFSVRCDARGPRFGATPRGPGGARRTQRR